MRFQMRRVNGDAFIVGTDRPASKFFIVLSPRFESLASLTCGQSRRLRTARLYRVMEQHGFGVQ
jgi:hypothetical protein